MYDWDYINGRNYLTKFQLPLSLMNLFSSTAATALVVEKPQLGQREREIQCVQYEGF